MKHITKYNHLFFTEQSKESDERNIPFWSYMASFDEKLTDDELTVIHDIRYEPMVGCYVEILSFQCNSKQILESVQEIYNKHYYGYPLKFIDGLKKTPTIEEIRSV